MENAVQEQLRHDRMALYGALEEAGATVTATGSIRCPFHDDRNPSGSVYPDEHGVYRFKCHGCGFGGDVFDVKARHDGRPLPEVLTGKAYGESRENRAIFPTREAAEEAIPGEQTANWTYRAANGEELFTVYRFLPAAGGKKQYWPLRKVPAGFVFGMPGKPWPLYNLAMVTEADVVALVEGEKCAQAIINLGLPATTTPCGAGNWKNADLTPLAGKKVILWPDNDKPGMAHMAGLSQALRALNPPAAVKIIDPMALELGEAEDVADYINGRAYDVARSRVLFALEGAKGNGAADLLVKRFESISGGEYRCVGFPWEMLTDITQALLPGTVTLLAGGPGTSKTLFTMQCSKSWTDAGEDTAVLSLEDPMETHMLRALSQVTGITGLTRADWVKEHREQADTLLKEHAGYMEVFQRHWFTGTGDEDLQAVAAWIEKQAAAGRRVIVVDPITAADVHGRQWVEDQKFIKAVKRVVEAKLCSVVLVTHPKQGQEVSIGKLAGGASYDRFTHCQIGIKRHEEKSSQVVTPAGTVDVMHNTTICIFKARNGRGAGMKLAYNFNAAGLTFDEIGSIVREHRDRKPGKERKDVD